MGNYEKFFENQMAQNESDVEVMIQIQEIYMYTTIDQDVR